jgi:hypothetical protein
MSFSGSQQQQQHNHQLLQYFCLKCGILLKKTEEEEQSLIDNQKIVLMPATTEQCLKCGSLLSSKNLIRKLKLKEHNSIEEQQHLSSSLLLRRTSEELSFPKFQTAYYDIEDRRRRITLDIEKIDSSITLTTEDCVCIIGEARCANAILMRLCVRALILKRQRKLLEFAKVIFIDAGGKNNSSDSFYRYVNFARQYGLDIKKVLQSIVISRAFTIYQLTDLIIYELPRVIQQLEAKVILISDLLNMFVCDPQIKIEEGERMIKEIINSLRKISSTATNNTLIVVSLYRHHHHHYSSFSSSYLYEKILLPRFDKCIEITNNKKEKVNNILDIKIRNHKNHHNDGISKNSSRRFSLSERNLMQLIPPTR